MTIRIPDGKKVAGVLSFDMDGQTAYMGGRSKTTDECLISRGEFGPRVAAQRILSLLAKYDIRSTWFIPGLIAETYPDLVRTIHREGHEVGNHGYNHEHFPTSFKSKAQERAVLYRSNDVIEAITGERPVGFRPPEGGITRYTTDLLTEMGFTYMSSMSAEDYRPYLQRSGDAYDPGRGTLRLGSETSLVQIPFHTDQVDFAFFEPWRGLQEGLASPSHVREVWINDFDYCYRNVKGGMYMLVCHPFVIGRGHRMMVLEDLIRHIAGQRTWWARCIDVARAFRR